MTGFSALGRRLHAASIWGPGAIGPQDVRVERLLRRALPEFYMACAIFGVLGALGGIPALRQTFGEDYAAVLGFAIAGAALACGVGEAFPRRLWRVEFYGVALLSGLILLYAAAVVVAGFLGHDAGRAAVGAAIYAMDVLPRWRIVDVRADRERNGWP